MSAFDVPSLNGRVGRRVPLWPAAAGAALAAVALAAGTVLSFAQPGVEATLISAIAVAGLVPVLVRLVAGTLDPFEPLVPATVAFVLLFIARPVFDHAAPTRTFAGQDLTAHYPKMLAVVLVGIVLFQIGYATCRPRGTVESTPAARSPDTGVLMLVAATLTLASLGFLLMRALLAGGLSSLFLDRSEIGARALNVPFISESVMLALPAVLVLWSVPRPHRAAARLLSIVPLAVLLISAIPQGNRRDLLPVVVAVTALAYLRRNARPRILSLAVVGALVFFLVVTPLRISRNGDAGYWASLVTAVEHPMRSIEGLFREQDTAMTTALAIEIRDVGTRIPWQHGTSVLSETALQPVPRQIWPTKPEPIRTQLIELNWGLRSGTCYTQCPTFSVLGSLYADAGLWTVGAGCLLFGALLARWYGYFQRRREDTLVQAAYAATLFLPFYVWWSSLGVLVLHFALLAAPLVVAARVARPERSA